MNDDDGGGQLNELIGGVGLNFNKQHKKSNQVLSTNCIGRDYPM